MTSTLEAKARQEQRTQNPDIYYYSEIGSLLDGLSLANLHIDDRLFLKYLKNCVLEKRIDVPQLPLVVLRINKMISQPNVTMKELSEAVKSDQKLALRILGMANAAAFGSQKTTSLELALARIGLKSLRGVVMASVMKAKVLKNKEFNQLSLLVWFHCFGTGMLAERFSRYLRLYTDTAFLTGFFHDVGKLVILNMIDELQRSKPDRELKLTLNQVHKVYQLVHPHVGALVTALNGLAPEITAAIEDHHNGDITAPPLSVALQFINQAVHAVLDQKVPLDEVLAFAERQRLPLPALMIKKTLREFVTDYQQEKAKLLSLM